MLNEGSVFATIAVKDINKGKDFYGGKLELEIVEEKPDGIMYKSGDGKLFVYQSSTAGTGQATCASWRVSDIESVINDLKGKDISFEQYDLPGVTKQGDIHVMGELKAAWFKDPDGNILGIINA